MRRLIIACYFVLTLCAAAQTSPQAPTSDPQAVTLAQQSVAALTSATVINDVTLSANVTQIYGSDTETGTGTFSAKGTSESRVDLSLSGGNRSDVRNAINGVPQGAWSANGATATAYAGHNCRTDAVWFFPALSSLTQVTNQKFIFKYIGAEQHNGVSVQHIRVFQTATNDVTGMIQRLSTTDFYLDTTTNLPDAIAVHTHADNNMGLDIPLEVRFTNYQAVNGVQVPFHFQQMLNGGVVLDATVTNVTFNTGLADTLFTLP